MKKFSIVLAAAFGLMASLAQANPLPLNICTGGEGGFYQDLGTGIGKAISKKTSTAVNILTTGGSVENASLLKDGECHMAIMQADAVTSLSLPSDLKVVDAHTEVVFWLFGKSGIDDFGVMEKDSVAKKYAFATVSGSGAEVTLKNWIETDKDYAGAVPVEFDDWYAAAEAVAQGFTMRAGVKVEIAGMLYISRPGKISTDITEDFGAELRVGEVNDGSFANSKDANGNPLYFACDISSKQTNGIKIAGLTDPDTYCLRAQVVYNNEYHTQLPAKEAREVRRAIDRGINSTVKAVR